MALQILEAANAGNSHKNGTSEELSTTELNFLLAPFDLKCLESHANDALDYHVALDLLPGIASLYFNHCLSKQIRITAMQSSILLALGLQRKSIEEVERELSLPVNLEALALFMKLVRKITSTRYPTSCNQHDISRRHRYNRRAPGVRSNNKAYGRGRL